MNPAEMEWLEDGLGHWDDESRGCERWRFGECSGYGGGVGGGGGGEKAAFEGWCNCSRRHDGSEGEGNGN